MGAQAAQTGFFGIERVRSGPLNFSLAEAARLVGVSERMMGLEVQRGNVKAIRIGRRVLIPKSEILRLTGSEAAVV